MKLLKIHKLTNYCKRVGQNGRDRTSIHLFQQSDDYVTARCICKTLPSQGSNEITWSMQMAHVVSSDVIWKFLIFKSMHINYGHRDQKLHTRSIFCVQTYIVIQTDTETYKLADRRTVVQTDRERRTDVESCRRTNVQTDEQTDLK